MSANLRRLHKVCHPYRLLFLPDTLSTLHFRTLIRLLGSPIHTNHILEAHSFCSSPSSSSSICALTGDFLEQFLPHRGSDSICNADVINLIERRRITIGLSKMIKRNQGYVLKGLSRKFCPVLLVKVMKFFDDRKIAFAFFKRAFQDHSRDTIKCCCIAAHLLAAGNFRLIAQDVIYWVIMAIGSDRSEEFIDLMWQDHGSYESDFSVLDSLMRGFVKSGMVSPALDVLARMRELAVVPSLSAVHMLISLLLRIGDYGSVWKLIRDMVLRYPRVSTRSFNVLILEFCRKGCLEIGESLFHLMGKYRCLPDVYTYNILINAYCVRGRTWEAYNFLRLMTECGCSPSSVTFGTLISAFCKEGNILEARKIFDGIHEFGVLVTTVTYNALIDGYIKAMEVDQANMLFDEMRSKGLAPDGITFNSLIAGNYRFGREEDVERLLREFSQSSLIPDCSLPDISVAALCWAGRLDEAIKLLMDMFDNGRPVSVIAFNSIVAACSKEGLVDKAFDVCKVMVGCGFTPSSLTCSSLLMMVLRHSGRPYEARYLMYQMRREGFRVNKVAFTVLLDGFCAAGDILRAQSVWEEMERCGISPDAVTFAAFVDGLSKEGFMEKALLKFDEMLRRRIMPNNFVYNSLIEGFCKYGPIEEALRLKEDMKERGLIPDNFTINIIINGFCKLGRMESAIEAFMDMPRMGLTPDIVTYNTLLDGYCKSLDMVRADDVVNKMHASGRCPDIFTYNIRMHGYFSMRRINHAIKMLDELVSAGILPNTVTYNTLINGLCTDELDRAMILTAKLLKMGFIPNIVTTNSLLSHFCKQGLPEKTLWWRQRLYEIGLFDDVTVEILDRAHLAHCKLQGNQEIGRVASKKSLFLDFLMYINCDIFQRNVKGN